MDLISLSASEKLQSYISVLQHVLGLSYCITSCHTLQWIIYLCVIFLTPITRTICSSTVSVVGVTHWGQRGTRVNKTVTFSFYVSKKGLMALDQMSSWAYSTSTACSVQSAPACLRERSTFTACLVMTPRNSLLQRVWEWSSPNWERK